MRVGPMLSAISSSVAGPVPARLRALRASDRSPIAALLRATDAFTAEEVSAALEAVDQALGEQDEDPYLFVVAANDHDVPIGYACFGHTPLTEGVYDLYWIAVDPGCRRGGVGRALLGAVDEAVRERAGRMIIIETAGKPEYAAQRAFYVSTGCVEVARIPDFYRVGDDKLIYARVVQPPH